MICIVAQQISISEIDDLSCFGRQNVNRVSTTGLGVGPSRRRGMLGAASRYHWMEDLVLGKSYTLCHHHSAIVMLTKGG
jgi:hypothetical protein